MNTGTNSSSYIILEKDLLGQYSRSCRRESLSSWWMWSDGRPFEVACFIQICDNIDVCFLKEIFSEEGIENIS